MRVKSMGIEFTRRDFLKLASSAGLGIFISPRLTSAVFKTQAEKKSATKVDIVVVENGSPAEMVQRAVSGIGGMSRFVKQGDVVVVKPNMSWDRLPKFGATTHPEVVAEVVRLCLEAGAKKVKVFDRTLNEPRRCYRHTGIQKAVKAVGGDVFFMYKRNYVKVPIPKGIRIKSWEVYRDVLEADVLINVPVVKHHGLTRVSMGIKNLMGFLGQNRGRLHRHFDQKIVDIATVLKPQLTILDATRVLLRNGPQGGNLQDVKWFHTIVVGTDMVATDSYGANFFGFQGSELGYLREAHARGLGEIDLTKLIIRKINLDKLNSAEARG